MSEVQTGVEQFDDADEALEAFEDLWDSGVVPDLNFFVSRCPRQEFAATVSELVQIDLERRWKDENHDRRRTVRHYQEHLPDMFDDSTLIELICWEYLIRNRWADCINLHQIYRRHQQLGMPLLQRLRETSALILWPILTIVVDDESVVSTPVDRRVKAGRQKIDEPSPWTLRSTAVEHRVVLCENSDPSLSRNQLSISMRTPGSVLVHNTSKRRALAIRDEDPLDVGQQRECALPLFIHLGEMRYLNVSTAGGSVRGETN